MITLIFLSQSSLALDTPFYYGFQIGMDSSTITTNNSLAADKGGMAMGLLLEKTVTKRLTLEIDSVFVQKGYSLFANPARDPGYEMDETLDYFEFPLLFKFDLTQNDWLRANLIAGPYIATRLPRTNAANSFFSPVTSAPGPTRSSDYGLDIGFQSEYELRPGLRGFFEMIFAFGLDKFANDGETGNRSVRNLIGLAFAI